MRQLTIISEDFSALTSHTVVTLFHSGDVTCGKLSFSSSFSDGKIFCSEKRLLTRKNFHLQLKES